MRVFWVILILLTGCTPQAPQPVQEFVGASVTGMKVDSAMQMTGHDGEPRSLADFRGKVLLLFFGYSHCPDVCPTTMSDLNKSLQLLGKRASEVQVVFVTLDPERDTVEVLRKYVPYFNPSFIGLRGDIETTKKLAESFKVYYAQQATESKAGYLIDHSAGLYVFDRKGELRLYLNYGQSSQNIAHDLAILLAEK